MVQLSWLTRIQTLCPNCPSCRAPNWVPGGPEPVQLLISPNTPMDHPELKYGMDGKAVLPVTCHRCGYVATYSIEHLENISPWE